MSHAFYGHGKLLITGEYLVLDGALALAIPTQKGQHLTVSESKKSGIKWTGIKDSGEEWFSFQLNYEQFDTATDSDLGSGAKTQSAIFSKTA